MEKSKLVKAILFDFDGVLTTDKTGTQSISNYICQKTNIDVATFKKYYYLYNDDLLCGKILHCDMWREFCTQLGIDIEFGLLKDSFIHTPMDKEMIHLVYELKNNYKIGMVTDNKADRIDTIIENENWGELFDVISISANVKSGKDNAIIFEETVKELQVSCEECIFIDNTPKNLVVPREMGMQTILFDDEKRDIQTFRQQLNLLLS